MAYRLKLDEPLERGLRRVAAEQIDRLLGAAPGDAAFQVHETRKSLKRLRALLRLLRGGLPSGSWRALNRELRDLGRLLARQRDRDVRRQTMASLGEGASKALKRALEQAAAIERAACAVGGRADGAASETDRDGAGLEAARARLQAVRSSLDRLRLDDGGFDIVEEGLVRTHRAGRRALAAVRRDPGDEAFHELRKRVQLHWRQMQLVASAWPATIKARAVAARDLAQTLGDEHDLSSLAAWAEGLAGSGLSPAAARQIAGACRKRQAALRATALLAAERLFHDRPRRFAGQIAAYWASSCSTLGPPAGEAKG